MTRSASQRRNRNARRIAALAPILDVLTLHRNHGAFIADSARRFAPLLHIMTFFEWRDGLDVNWQYCAELLNRRARLSAPLRFPELLFEMEQKRMTAATATMRKLIDMELDKVNEIIGGPPIRSPLPPESTADAIIWLPVDRVGNVQRLKP